jgi:uncharacterized ion transporter superfamily protein YfcC
MSTKRKFQAPHGFVIIFCIILLVTFATYVIPAGQFDRVENVATGRMVVDADSYHRVEQSPVGLFGLFVNIKEGFVSAADVIFLIFFAYAYIFVILKTGAFHGLIKRMLELTEGKEHLMIPAFMIVFGLAGSTYGEFETIYGLIPIFVGLAIVLGYDAIVGLSMSGMAVAVGFAAGTTNPFTVGIAQSIAELPLFSGLLFRWFAFVVFMTIAIWWTMRYAKMVKNDPEKSLVKDINFGELTMRKDDLKDAEFTGRHKIIMIGLVFAIATIVYGSLNLGWWLNEMSAVFIIGMVISGYLGGFGANKIAETFIEGCSAIVMGALIVGLARAVLMVLMDGRIIDTVVYSLSVPLGALPAWGSAIGMLVSQTIINFFIPSGSGQATAIMPIMTPLADLVGITRQVAVLAAHFGDGFSNLLWPTTGIIVMCGVSKVPYIRWIKYFLPLFGIMFLAQAVLLIIGVATGYGPF